MTLFQKIIILFGVLCPSFRNGAAYSAGELRQKDVAGIWRLTSKRSFLPRIQDTAPKKDRYPMKEFTVYPKKQKAVAYQSGSNSKYKDEEMLLVLKEDGKFMQYGGLTMNAEKGRKKKKRAKFGILPKTEEEIEKEMYGSVMGLGVMKGTWNVVDGKLILAADRPSNSDVKSVHDTILVGNIVVTSGDSLVDNPALLSRNETGSIKSAFSPEGSDSNELVETTNDPKSELSTESSSVSSSASIMDVHLSVPKGKVKIGKFFYPQNHPSFFEQPIFKPVPTGSFELKQVLGSLNTRREEEKHVEKFKKQDLMNKRYFLTSYPLPTNKRKGRQRWSIKYNKFVSDKPKTEKDDEMEEREKNAPIPIRTFEVELFANNTFSTITGLGDKVLRGKWWIIGDDRDQLWMQIWRFGFGRSVSGSTYSEGKTLSQKDEVTYWGKIYEVDVSEKEDSIEDDPNEWKGVRIEINGSVMDGWGLEPCSVARFTMVEKTEDDGYYDDEEEDDDDDDDDEDFRFELDDNVGAFE